MRSHFVVGARPGRRDRAAEKLLTTSWESSWIHFIIWQDVMEKIYKISWCCRFRRASKWKSICHGSHQLEVLFLPRPWWSIFHAYTSTWLSSTNQISFLLARCDVIVTTSGRCFTPSDSRCLSGNKTGESSSRRCWKLDNQFANRLIVDEIFWSRLMNFRFDFFKYFMFLRPNMTSHVRLIGRWPSLGFAPQFLETLIQSFPTPVAQLFKYVPKLLEYSSSLERISTFFRDELKLSPQNLIRMKKKVFETNLFHYQENWFPMLTLKQSGARKHVPGLFVKLGDRKSS